MTTMDATVLVEGLRKMAKKNSIFSKFEIPTKIDGKLCLRTTGIVISLMKYTITSDLCVNPKVEQNHKHWLYTYFG